MRVLTQFQYLTNTSRAVVSTLALVVFVLASPGATQGADRADDAEAGLSASALEDESYRYRWNVSSFAGFLLKFSSIPSQGEGSLSFVHDDRGHMTSELLMTSEHSDQGEYWRYGSEVDSNSGRALRAWSSYRWRGEDKKKADEIAQQGVIDVALGIYRIRKNPPKTSRNMRIWSDGKVYPVEVIRKGTANRRIGRRVVPVTRYVIRGRDLPGERDWKGKIELWLAHDETSTPVEIRIQRSIAAIRLLLEGAES